MRRMRRNNEIKLNSTSIINVDDTYRAIDPFTQKETIIGL